MVDETGQAGKEAQNMAGFGLPVTLIGGGVLFEASAKSIAKALASGLQERANVEGVISIISGLAIVVGIVLLVRVVMARRKPDQ
jgi:hypothetical protein